MRAKTPSLACAAILAAGLLSLLPGPAAAQERLALVFGNSRYEGGTWLPLVNPARDARAIAATLRSLGFQIVGCGDAGICLDSTRSAMDSAIREFGRSLKAHRGAIAFVYYSGHGVQARRAPDAPDENFLIPLGSGVEDEFEVAAKAIPVQQLLDVLSAVGVEAGIIVLDACRNNGLARNSRSANSKGLAASEGGGLLIAYAAEPGQIALDSIPGGPAPLSPYARRLSEQLTVPGKSIMDVFLDVRAQVIDDTHGQQRPEAVMRLNRRVYLAGTAHAAMPGADSAASASSPASRAAPVDNTPETDTDAAPRLSEAACERVHAGKGMRPKSLKLPALKLFLETKTSLTLMAAFNWSDTPQGHEYWSRQAGLVFVSKPIEKDALLTLRCWARE